MRTTEIAASTRELMPSLIESLEPLVALPSIAFPGYPSEPVETMATTPSGCSATWASPTHG